MRALLIVAAGTLLSLGSGCGSGAKKPAADATTTPADEGAPKWDSSSETASTPSDSSGSSGSSSSGSSGGAGTTRTVADMQAPKARSHDVYDKENTDIVLKRAARQVKENCGSAKDEDGKAPGPWGKTSAAVVLGHNGHSKGVTVGPPYDGTPGGRCILQAFSNLTFPPWSGPDTTVNWDLELVQPKP
ncbi:MAG: hypothetical protein ABIP39_07465 [Polyangiaceae bacterium]